MSDVAIRARLEECLLSYTRGVDRLDTELIAAAFHPGAELLDYGPEPTTIEAFLDRVVSSLSSRFSATQHRVSNIAIDFRDGGAVMEAYVLAFHVMPTDDGDQLLTFNGRYIDFCDERDGDWRIARRQLRVDWSKAEPIEATMGGAWVPSARDKSDPVY